MTTYYIDFQNGCDENDGLRPETPFRTQHPELLKPDDTVLFRRGTMFRGPLQNPSGRWEHPIHYGAYGEGEPPVFCGSQSLSDASLWKSVGKNIWQYTGILASEAANLIYGDGTCGALRWTREELCEQGDWFDSCLGYSIQHLPLAEDHTLLVYSRENPAAFYGSIECATSQYRWLAHCGHDMVISDLEFRNNGLHGIAGEEGGRNLRIENCRFAKIGGAVWEKDQKIRFGNAFECWNVAENVEVEHCAFDDIYDSAVTHQGGADCKPAYHFLIRSNTFRRCGMAAYEQRDLLPTYAEFTDNVCENAGMGFSRLGETMPRRSEIWPQPMGHHVFLWRISHATGNEHFALCRNTFGDAPYGAAVYSVNPSEADRLVHLEENRYPMQRYTLVGRMYGIDYPDPSAWESRRKEESERESSMKVFTVALIGAGNRGEIYTDIMKTQALKQALDKYGFTAAFGGGRRDEEKSRAKERIFSFRNEHHAWDPKNQRPEMWKLYNSQIQKHQEVRVFPLSNWTETDIWQYIRREKIEIPSLYFAKVRPVVYRDGNIIMVDDDLSLIHI